MRRENLSFIEQQSKKNIYLRTILIKIIKEIRLKLAPTMKQEKRWGLHHRDDFDYTNYRDTNILGHTLNTFSIVKELKKYDRQYGFLTAEEWLKLKISALIHDLGELNTGDVPLPLKNQDNINKEVEFFLKQILAQQLSSLEPTEQAEIKDIYLSICQQKNSTNQDKLILLFHLIENIGYLDGLLKLIEQQKDNSKDNFNTIAAWLSISEHNLNTYYQYIEQYPIIKEFFRCRKMQIQKFLDQNNLDPTIKNKWLELLNKI